MSPLTKTNLSTLAALSLGALALPAAPIKPDYHLEAIPENMVAGHGCLIRTH